MSLSYSLGCPQCLTTFRSKPSLTLRFSECCPLLVMCSACLESNFSGRKRTMVCPECKTEVRRENFRAEDLSKQRFTKMVEFRKRLNQSDFILKKEDFQKESMGAQPMQTDNDGAEAKTQMHQDLEKLYGTPAYNAYLERCEEILVDLVYGNDNEKREAGGRLVKMRLEFHDALARRRALGNKTATTNATQTSQTSESKALRGLKKYKQVMRYVPAMPRVLDSAESRKQRYLDRERKFRAALAKYPAQKRVHMQRRREKEMAQECGLPSKYWEQYRFQVATDGLGM